MPLFLFFRPRDIGYPPDQFLCSFPTPTTERGLEPLSASSKQAILPLDDSVPPHFSASLHFSPILGSGPSQLTCRLNLIPACASSLGFTSPHSRSFLGFGTLHPSASPHCTSPLGFSSVRLISRLRITPAQPISRLQLSPSHPIHVSVCKVPGKMGEDFVFIHNPLAWPLPLAGLYHNVYMPFLLSFAVHHLPRNLDSWCC